MSCEDCSPTWRKRFSGNGNRAGCSRRPSTQSSVLPVLPALSSSRGLNRSCAVARRGVFGRLCQSGDEPDQSRRRLIGAMGRQRVGAAPGRSITRRRAALGVSYLWPAAGESWLSHMWSWSGSIPLITQSAYLSQYLSQHSPWAVLFGALASAWLIAAIFLRMADGERTRTYCCSRHAGQAGRRNLIP